MTTFSIVIIELLIYMGRRSLHSVSQHIWDMKI